MRIVTILLIVAAAAPAGAGKLKASFDCKKVLKEDLQADIPAEGPRLDAVRIECVVESKSHALLEGGAYIKPIWHKGSALQPTRERHGEPIGEGPPYQIIFSMERGIDWDACASDVTFPLTVTGDKDEVIFEARKTFKQSCATPSRFDEGELDKIPAEARGPARDFVDAMVDSDPPAIAVMAGAGVRKGKRVLKGNDAFTGNGLAPQHACDENGANCKWGQWVVVVKSPSEFCVYTQNDSGYGKFPCATFRKQGADWKWTAMTYYDTGEP